MNFNNLSICLFFLVPPVSPTAWPSADLKLVSKTSDLLVISWPSGDLCLITWPTDDLDHCSFSLLTSGWPPTALLLTVSWLHPPACRPFRCTPLFYSWPRAITSKWPLTWVSWWASACNPWRWDAVSSSGTGWYPVKKLKKLTIRKYEFWLIILTLLLLILFIF